MAQRLDDHVDRYDRDRVEEREDRRKWRDDIQQDVQKNSRQIEAVEKKMEPVFNDHKTVMRLLRWSGIGGVAGLAVWSWKHLKDAFS